MPELTEWREFADHTSRLVPQCMRKSNITFRTSLPTYILARIALGTFLPLLSAKKKRHAELKHAFPAFFHILRRNARLQ